MDGEPYNLLTRTAFDDPTRFEAFVHRTFNAADCYYFIRAHSLSIGIIGGLKCCLRMAFSLIAL
jgi:hypothetical protein